MSYFLVSINTDLTDQIGTLILAKSKYGILFVCHAKKTYAGVEEKSHPFLISALEGDEALYLFGNELS
jgi:hypothetical protein